MSVMLTAGCLLALGVLGVNASVPRFPARGNYPAGSEITSRSFITDRRFLWETKVVDGKPIVLIPYVTEYLEPSVWPYVQHYMEVFRQKSCVQWIPRTNERVFVKITGIPDHPTPFCFSGIGYNERDPINLYLSRSCLFMDTPYPVISNVPHEMMHVMGFVHEHTRLDRDCFVYMTGDALNDEMNYGVYRRLPTDDTFPYDPHSIMHYPSMNIIHSRMGDELGPVNDSLSFMDWVKLNYIYCGGQHYCQINPSDCERHQSILRECGYRSNQNGTKQY